MVTGKIELHTSSYKYADDEIHRVLGIRNDHGQYIEDQPVFMLCQLVCSFLQFPQSVS